MKEGKEGMRKERKKGGREEGRKKGRSQREGEKNRRWLKMVSVSGAWAA